jgi:hypothetical protein
MFYPADRLSGLNSRPLSICHKQQKCQRAYYIECTLDKRANKNLFVDIH